MSQIRKIRFESDKILYLKHRAYYFLMFLIVIPLSHISINENIKLLLIIDLIIFCGFVIDFLIRNVRLEFDTDFFNFWSGIGNIKILNRIVLYNSLMHINLNSFSVFGNEYFNLIIRYKDLSKRLAITREFQISFNYFDENDIVKILDTFLDRTNTTLKMNNKIMSDSEILEFKNNLAKAI